MDGPPNSNYDAFLYEIRYEALFEQEFAIIEPDNGPRRRRLEPIEYILSRIPTDLDRIEDSNIYRLEHHGIPPVRVWSTVDGSTVTLRLIQELEDDSDGG